MPVFGVKGGVGQSVIAVNLAVALHDVTKKRVILLDANMQSGDVGALLDIFPRYDLSDLLPRADDLDDDLMDAVLGRHSSGIEVIIAARGLPVMDAVEAEPLKKILLALSEICDYVVVDCSPFPARCAQAALETADAALLVTTAEVTSVRKAHTFLKNSQEADSDPQRFFGVLNRYTPIDGVKTRAFAGLL